MLKRLLLTFVLALIIINIISFNHAWRFTHYDPQVTHKTTYEELTLPDKIKYGFMGVSSPRPENEQTPSIPYKTVSIQSNVKLECWYLPNKNAKGTIIMLHGYISSKDKMLDKAYLLHKMGYNIMLADFMGSGGSESNGVTIGYREAENVRDCYKYLQQKGEDNIILFGISMGAAASMRAIKDYNIHPSILIIEAPFGTLFNAVTNRFDLVGAPYFPMAHLLVMWGGIQHGFNAFTHSPIEYAKHISCPTMILYGGKDKRVQLKEEKDILNNLQGPKQLKVYPKAGHVRYLQQYKREWINDISRFLQKYTSRDNHYPSGSHSPHSS